MYGSTTPLVPRHRSADGDHDFPMVSSNSNSRTPLISNHHDFEAAEPDESSTTGHSSPSRLQVQQQLLPPPNYDHRRRLQDLRQMQQQQQQSSSSSTSQRRTWSLSPLHRAGSVPVLKNVVRDGHHGSSSPRHPNQEHRSKRSKQQPLVVLPSSATNETTTATTAATATKSPNRDDDSMSFRHNQKTIRHRNRKQRHSFLYSMLNPHSRRWQANLYKTLITGIITSDLLMFIASTDESAHSRLPQLFSTWEAVISYIFLLEYTARLAVIVEKPKYAHHPIAGRLRYALGGPSAWIDLLAAAPYFVEQITGWRLPTLTVLRLFRLVRILQTQSYMRALDAVYRVVYYNSEILYVAALICVFLTVSTALLLYILRPEPDEANDFGSIAATLYLSTLLLTGQGGPGGDLPWYTKSVVLLTSVFSVAIFAIPASMLTWGFEAEAERMATVAYRKATAAAANNNNNNNNAIDSNSSSSSSTSEGDTTDDEYFKLLAGGGDDDKSNHEEEAPWAKEIRQSFEQADVNHDGTLSLPELVELMTQQRMQQQQQPSASLEEWTTRLDALETKVRDTNEKLDRILELLQPTRI